MLQPWTNTGYFQDALLFFQVDAHMSGDGVGESARLVDTGQRGQYLGRNLFTEIDVFLKLGNRRAQQPLDLVFGNGIADDFTHAGNGKVAFVIDTVNNSPVTAFHQDFYCSVGQFQQLQDI